MTSSFPLPTRPPTRACVPLRARPRIDPVRSTMQVIDAPELDQIVHDNPVLYLFLHDDSNARIVVRPTRHPVRVTSRP